MKKRRYKAKQKTSRGKQPHSANNATTPAIPKQSSQAVETPASVRELRQRYQLNHGHYFLFFLLFLSIFFTYKLMEPYLNPIILATILAILLKPVYEWIAKLCRGRKNLAAFLTCTLLTLLVVLPLTFMLYAIFQQGGQAYKAIDTWVKKNAVHATNATTSEGEAQVPEQKTTSAEATQDFEQTATHEGGETQTPQQATTTNGETQTPEQETTPEGETQASEKGIITRIKEQVSKWGNTVSATVKKYFPDIQKFFPDFNLKSIQLDEILISVTQTIGTKLVSEGGQLFGNITSLVVKFFLMLFAFFFIVRDQDKMFAAILHLIPLPTSHEQQILDKIKSVAKSALLGTFATAVAQGIAGGIAFSIVKLPGLFWGTMMAFASLIPVVGTTLIWVPAALFLLVSGHWGYSLFMAIWCAVIVGSIDNFVRPLFMKGAGGNTSTLIIFFSIMGGLNLFGLIGLIYGPLIIGLMMVFLYIYNLEFKSFLDQQDIS